jgi:opacity protein-like surface antigen
MIRCLIAVGLACVLVSSAPTQAQVASSEQVASPKTRIMPFKSERPLAAARKPFFVPTGLDLKASIGYVFTNSGMPSAGRLNLSGVDAAVIADLSPFFGVTADSSYVRAENVFGTNHAADVLSYLAGPILYPVAHGRMRVYVHGLAGGARVTGAIPSGGNPPVTGFVNKFSWAVGGGVEYQISPSVALRSGGDYQHLAFFDSGGAIRGQQDFRFVSSLIFSVWQNTRRRH